MAYASRLYPRAEPRSFTLQRIKICPTIAEGQMSVFKSTI